MEAKRMSSDAVRQGWRDVVDGVMAGGTVLVERYSKPVAVVIPYADFMAVREQLEELQDIRLAEESLAEYRRDPSTAMPIEEAIALWEAGEPEEAESGD